MNWISRIQDKRSFTGGIVLLIYGALLIVYSLNNYSVGTLSQMGPGMFPVLVGSVLMALSVLVVIPAIGTAGTPFHVKWRPLLSVLAAIATCALLMEPFGLVPAIVVMTAVSGFAGNRLSARTTALLAIVIAVPTVLIFRFGLKLRFEIFAWPF